MVPGKENKGKIDTGGSPPAGAPGLNQSRYLICLPDCSVPDMPDQGGSNTAAIVSSVSEVQSHHNNPDGNGKTHPGGP